MDLEEIKSEVRLRFNEISEIESEGESIFYFNPGGGKVQRDASLLVIRSRDRGEDRISRLDAAQNFRLDWIVQAKTFEGLFGALPKQPKPGLPIVGSYDFAKRNILMPHPFLAWAAWICLISPTEKNFSRALIYLDEAYEIAREAHRTAKNLVGA